MIQPGQQLWKLKKNFNGGRLSKTSWIIINELAGKGLNLFREVLEKQDTSYRWMQLKVDVAKTLLSKIAPDLTAEMGEEWKAKYDERVKGFTMALASNGDIPVIESRPADNSVAGCQ